MIIFFQLNDITYAVDTTGDVDKLVIEKLTWLFGNAMLVEKEIIPGDFIGPRKEMITPWSTNAVEITQNMGVTGIMRVERFHAVDEKSDFDPMLESLYHGLDQNLFTTDREPEEIKFITDLEQYNQQEGLALSKDEIEYLQSLSKKISRPLTDSEVFGFSEINSEHCRHKIFNGSFVIDGKEKPSSLFAMIKETHKRNPNHVISAYKDNVAFIDGPTVEQFAPERQDKSSFFKVEDIDSVISVKAETHNFPTTVEPFNGAATGSGGEIRDRMGGGKGSMPIAGNAVYMTSYPRHGEIKPWESNVTERKWIYHNPEDILIKASNGASDFGNKFGQPLINGSLLTFEHATAERLYGYDKVIMLAGGIGYAKKQDSKKEVPAKGDKIVLLGGDNYRIGMGGASVSSVNTGEYQNKIELNAVQRSNPEMQKRVANVVRAFAEMHDNSIISIHDHGAGGHLNCFSELVEDNGGVIYLDKLPIGDATLSSKEILGNESQERMGLVIKTKDIALLSAIAKRERCPMYVVGEVSDDNRFIVIDQQKSERPIDLEMGDFFGNSPKTTLYDEGEYRITESVVKNDDVDVSLDEFETHLENVLSLESVGSKDWLTNKADRSVTGKVAMQQCAGIYQLPINDLGVMALDYRGVDGIASSIGHAPVVGLLDAAEASRLSVCEALTNIVFAPLKDDLKSVSLSANWMWPAKNPGENARLYNAVEAISKFCIELGINIPTGKDSLSMTQKYPDGTMVYAPGTVIVSAAAQVADVKNVITPVLQPHEGSKIIYIDFSSEDFNLGGSAFAQTLNSLGDTPPKILSAEKVVNAFNAIQHLIKEGYVLAGHDVSSGGLITTLLEMCFSTDGLSMDLLFDVFENVYLFNSAFSEKPAVVLQVKDCNKVAGYLLDHDVDFYILGDVVEAEHLIVRYGDETIKLNISDYRDIWNHPAFLFNSRQTAGDLASERYMNIFEQPLKYRFGQVFTGRYDSYDINPHRREPSGIRAAIIREKGVNGDREMAYALYLAGFDVKDVHTTDLINGTETLDDVNMIVFVGGFSNSDVLGSAKGWAGALKFNDTAKKAIERFYSRQDTLSLGVCNGCQLMVELGLIYPDMERKPSMTHNDSHKFESGFVNVTVKPNNSVMLGTLAGSRLGVWIAHGEGKFILQNDEKEYNIPLKYSFKEYPGNPNGSDYDAAALCSKDGRHLAMMPHLERAFLPWQWPYHTRKNDEITPWLLAFVNARNWIKDKIK